jgi:hypothetical protein
VADYLCPDITIITIWKEPPLTYSVVFEAKDSKLLTQNLGTTFSWFNAVCVITTCLSNIYFKIIILRFSLNLPDANFSKRFSYQSSVYICCLHDLITVQFKWHKNISWRFRVLNLSQLCSRYSIPAFHYQSFFFPHFFLNFLSLFSGNKYWHELVVYWLLVCVCVCVRACVYIGKYIQDECSMLHIFYVIRPTQQWLYSLTWKHQPLFCTYSFIPFFFPSSYAFFHTFIPEHDCTPLQCFLQKLYTYSQLRNLLLVCWCTAYVTAVTLYFHTKHLKEDQHKGIIGCAELHNKRF